MQRHHAGGCNSAVNNSAISGLQARDGSRADSSPNFSLNSRRASQVTPYKLKCEKEQLNSRLGPPDFHQPSVDCHEEILTREYAQSGYRETVEGLEEAREISLSQVQAFTKPITLKSKEAIRKCHRAINESRTQKRKAGQVYGVPLSGALLTKPGIFPEQRPCGEDVRKKWIEGLSQQHKRLRSLADHVPHGYRRSSLFEVLIRNNVPLLRATWYIKVSYLNQVRSTSSSSSAQSSRSEQWTKDIIDYLKGLLEEFATKSNSHSTFHIRDWSSQMLYAGSMHPKSNSFSPFLDGDEPSLYTKWWYAVRIIHWHHSEGLLVPSLIIDWVLNQLQEKESLNILQLLLPIIYGVIETVVLSQTYVRSLVQIALRFSKEPSPGGSDLVDNSRRAYTNSAIVEMLRYLILAAPDTFVALDCFPLPKCVSSQTVNDGSFLNKMAKDGQLEVSGTLRDKIHTESLSFNLIVSSIQKRAETLSRAAKPNNPGHNVVKALQVLDQALVNGDIEITYDLLFENLWDGVSGEQWIAQVSPCLYVSLKKIGEVTSSVLCAIFFMFEWATCEFRDFRNAPPGGIKFTGKRDFSQILIAVRLLNLYVSKRKRESISETFESPGHLHDVIVCWIDQHEVHNGEGFKRLQLLIGDLIRAGIFNPHAYVRQLTVSGIMDGSGPMVDLERQKRHYELLKHLPAHYIRDALEEAQMAEPQTLMEASNVYTNERRMLLHGLLKFSKSTKKPNLHHSSGIGAKKLAEVKASISVLLQFPLSSSLDSEIDESQGSVKGPVLVNDVSEETSGCEECRKVKRQKLSDEGSSLPRNEEELWWGKKGINIESFKAEPPKPTKQTSKGRPKSVRKTQSLAHLAAARIESSQGASTSHLCESRIACPHHGSGSDVTKRVDGFGKSSAGDIGSIGKILKKMRFSDKRTMSTWLISTVKQFIEEGEKITVNVGQFSRPVPAIDDRSSIRWKLGEDELSAILYVLDCCGELISATKFLLWLLQKVPTSPAPINHGRNNLIVPRIVENHVCELGETFLLSSIRRYENTIVAADLIPEILSVTMRRTAAVLASNSRPSASPSFKYACHLLKKYSNVASVVEWEKSFKSTCDKKLNSELESGKSLEGFPFVAPNGVEDVDDYFRQKITGVRASRVGLNMKDIVHRHIDEVIQSFYSKDRKKFSAGVNKNSGMEKWEGTRQIAYQIVTGLMDCMRQTGGAAQEGDPSLVSSAISTIVNSVGQAIAVIPDLNVSSLHFARHILRIHLNSLCVLKEALGERQSRVFEVALATEASTALMQAFAPGKASRNQFQVSPDSHFSNSNLPNDALNNSNIAVVGRASRIKAAVSSLVIGAILQGVTSLERMVTLFRLKEGIDLIQFTRSLKSNMNGNSRSSGVLKMDNLVEVSVNWFRVLVGNCRTVCDGFIVDLLGEASIVALFRMQRSLPLNLVFPPAYSIFAFVIWKPVLDSTIGVREDFHQLMATTMCDTIKHLPVREICLRDTHGLYDPISENTLDSEFLTMLESSGSNFNLQAAAMIPLRSRIFLDAILDCKMPPVIKLDDGKWVSGQSELKKHCEENVKRLMGKIVNVLDTLQPARFHWQWIELRLLLNEQAVNEKMMENDISLAEAIRALSPNPDKNTASEIESNFIQIILTRLLVRPDAAPLFSELVHLLGKLFEDSMLSQAKWLLRGTEVLYGKKSIRQKIINFAGELKELSLKPQHWKPWGWCNSEISPTPTTKKGEKRKFESVEEGEVVDEGTDFNRKGTGILDVEGFIVSQQHVTERALIELILPCLDRGSNELRNNFASEMIKQMSNIEQQISSVTRGAGKPAGGPTPAVGSPGGKSGNRKSGKSGSPVISRQSAGSSADTVPPSPAALRASMTLRLQFLLRLIPNICSDREPSGRNMRYTLASVILRLLGSRIVHEDASHFVKPVLTFSKREMESLVETTNASALLCGESLFDCLLLVLHVLLSSHQPSWLKSKSESKFTEYPVFDRDLAESLQNDLDRMELPKKIRIRIQTAMPILFPSVRCSISCQPPSVSSSSTALACLQPSYPVTLLAPKSINPPQRNQLLPGRALMNLKTKTLTPQPDLDSDFDPWTLLEDGARSCQLSTNSTGVSSNEHANLKASSFLKGSVRMRRTDLTYIGTVDEDS